MLNLFGDRKSRLEKKYRRLLDEAYRLSHTDRKQSDLKTAEADTVRQQIEALEQTEGK
jgi:hypothetical protein